MDRESLPLGSSKPDLGAWWGCHLVGVQLGKCVLGQLNLTGSMVVVGARGLRGLSHLGGQDHTPRD